MANIQQIKQQALRLVQDHYHLDPVIRYQSVIAELPLEEGERASCKHKFYIQIEGRAALVYYAEPDDYRVDEDVKGFGRVTFGHI